MPTWLCGDQSFAKGVDMEDLGRFDPSAMPRDPSASIAVPDDVTMPAWLRDYNAQVIPICTACCCMLAQRPRCTAAPCQCLHPCHVRCLGTCVAMLDICGLQLTLISLR